MPESPDAVQPSWLRRVAGRPAFRIGIELVAKGLAFVVFGTMLRISLAGVWANGQGAWEEGGVHRWAETADRAAMSLFLFLVLLAYAARPLAARSATGVWPRVFAYLGGFVVTPLPLLWMIPVPWLVLGWRNPTLSFVGLGLTLVGHALSAASIGTLGRSFSIAPEARKLVTRGPYRWVRHPVYVAEALAAVGVVMGNASPLAVAILAAHFGIQYYRICNEERVLAAQFPEYRDYARRVGMLLPGVHWPKGATAGIR